MSSTAHPFAYRSTAYSEFKDVFETLHSLELPPDWRRDYYPKSVLVRAHTWSLKIDVSRDVYVDHKHRQAITSQKFQHSSHAAALKCALNLINEQINHESKIQSQGQAKT